MRLKLQRVRSLSRPGTILFLKSETTLVLGSEGLLTKHRAKPPSERERRAAGRPLNSVIYAEGIASLSKLIAGSGAARLFWRLRSLHRRRSSENDAL
jgi:hypothetical protein